MCRPRFDVATFIANEDSLDCRGAPARGGTPPAALADCALLLHGIDPIPQRRCCAGGGRGHAGLDQRLPSVAPSESTDSAAVRGFNFTSWHQLKAWVRHRRIRARYSDFAICSCGGISQICQWYRVCDAGALRAEPLATLLSCAVKRSRHPRQSPVHVGLLKIPVWWRHAVVTSLPWVCDRASKI